MPDIEIVKTLSVEPGEAPVTAGPKSPVNGNVKRADFARRKAVLHTKRAEADTFIPKEAALGGDPDEPLVVLRKCADIEVFQPLLLRVVLEAVLLGAGLRAAEQ